jgi:P27 family predicted phage terminase small subunit
VGGNGSGGHNRKPTAVKELQGNAGHRKPNADEPKPELGTPEKPKGMSKAASREWDRIVPALMSLGVLTVVDGKALAGYCDAYAYWELARKEMDDHGLVVEEPILNKEGDEIGEKLKANPAVSIYATMGKLMKSFLVEFGLTPASRSKLKVEKPKPADPMDAYLKQGGQEADSTGDAFADMDDEALKVQ